ncbi:hypothetical protein SK854_33560 [Lentzea sp. BCCO 10_0061]|uniref:Uncharacterized protein n=1 Tax=Lentzea sokolovensis TaxID=3095429 RepID=A0ABU4V893_9PSEU|nr:hypothetical protein [Lentzea sp. BCCO 10_0061]MDX8147080.1 hypothetical protein [Lentzea sp. BCCO 10_0061]
MLVKIDQAMAAHHEAADLAEQARDLLSVAGTARNRSAHTWALVRQQR